MRASSLPIHGNSYRNGFDEALTMKKLTAVFTALLLLAMAIPAMAASAINQDGCYKGIKLCGRVKVVEHFADIKVKYVNSFPGVE